MRRVHDESKAQASDPPVSGSEAQGTCEPNANTPPTRAKKRSRRKKRSRKFWAGTVTVGTGVLAAWLAAWLLFVAGPPDPTTSTATLTGPLSHPTSGQDGSTTSSAHRFYVVANFSQLQSCGSPCWLPLYQLPTHDSTQVTQGWPCEYYQQSSSSSGPYCLQPPAGRTAGEMANPAEKNSGDRLLVVCQATNMSNGQAAQSIRNDAGQSSDVWDMVAVPADRVFRNNAAVNRLTPVPDMPGFYEAYGPDIWFGDTGWHNIPCQ
jgi:hypothetical protein